MGSPVAPRKTLLTGWFSFVHGEVTAGDLLALRRIRRELERARLACDTAWSPGFRPDALHLENIPASEYDRLVFVCGPLHGPGIARLHRDFAHCLRVAVGVSVPDPENPAARGFHRILARDAPGDPPAVDLAASAPLHGGPRPVAGLVLTRGQGEYGARRRHEQVARAATEWLAGRDCVPLELDTRLATGDWRCCATPEQLLSLIARLDMVVTDRLHGLVLALRAGVPVLALDPVAGGAKVTEQAHACGWPALVPAEHVGPVELDRWWSWCLGPGRRLARLRRRQLAAAGRADGGDRLASALTAALFEAAPVAPAGATGATGPGGAAATDE